MSFFSPRRAQAAALMCPIESPSGSAEYLTAAADAAAAPVTVPEFKEFLFRVD